MEEIIQHTIDENSIEIQRYNDTIWISIGQRNGTYDHYLDLSSVTLYCLIFDKSSLDISIGGNTYSCVKDFLNDIKIQTKKTFLEALCDSDSGSQFEKAVTDKTIYKSFIKKYTITRKSRKNRSG